MLLLLVEVQNLDHGIADVDLDWLGQILRGQWPTMLLQKLFSRQGASQGQAGLKKTTETNWGMNVNVSSCLVF